MKVNILTTNDIVKYGKDILKCFNDNRFIFDSQSPYIFNDIRSACDYLSSFVQSKDSLIYAIFSDDDRYLYGIVILDNIRIVGNEGCAQVHIATDKAIWGKTIKNIYKELLDSCIVNNLYCEIPQIAVNAIAMCKRLGFKKTGFIPKALPYINSRGEEKLYDINIFSYRRPDAKI